MSYFVPTVGVYAMHHMNEASEGTLVLIISTTQSGAPGFGVEYVGEDGRGGGSSFYWPASQFRPITKERLLIAAKIHEYHRLATRLFAEHKQAAEDADQYRRIGKLLDELRRNIDATAKATDREENL